MALQALNASSVTLLTSPPAAARPTHRAADAATTWDDGAGEHPLARTRRRRSRPRAGRRARLEVGDQPRPAAGRALRRPGHRRRGPADPRHRADGRRAARPRRPGRRRRRARGRRRRTTASAAAGPSTAGWPAPSCGSCRPPPRSPTARCASTVTPAPGNARWARCWTRCARSARGSTACRAGGSAVVPPVHAARHGRLPGGEVMIDASASSQFVSGAAAVGRPVRQGRDGGPRGQAGAVAAAHRHDRGHAAQRGRGGRRRDAEHAGGSHPARSPAATGRRARPVQVDPELVVPDDTKSINEGAITVWTSAHVSEYWSRLVEALAEEMGFRLDVPIATCRTKCATS